GPAGGRGVPHRGSRVRRGRRRPAPQGEGQAEPRSTGPGADRGKREGGRAMCTREDELKSDLERQREALGEDLEAVGDRVSPGRVVERRRAALRQGFGRLRDRVMGTADSARGGMSDAAGTASQKAGEATEAAKDRLSAAPQAVGSAPEGNPLAGGVIAFGAGLLA